MKFAISWNSDFLVIFFFLFVLLLNKFYFECKFICLEAEKGYGWTVIFILSYYLDIYSPFEKVKILTTSSFYSDETCKISLVEYFLNML